jgi:hypothetical protein
VIAVDQALCRLGELDTRKSEILEMYYFGGMTAEEFAVSYNFLRPR